MSELKHFLVCGERYHGVMQDGERATEPVDCIVVARGADEAWQFFARHLGDDAVPSMEANIASTFEIPTTLGHIEELQ